MLDLHKGARQDERFHLQHGEPRCVGDGDDRRYRSVKWYGLYLEDGSEGWFNSYVLFWRIRWYIGNVKCDPTRTGYYRKGWLDDLVGEHYTPDPN